ncbi:hypothetical protein [Nonlabens sp. YIK11]|uniref:hypothetical protein n=1 Tax=Nonlabens sp. YIK11 TaxID=1453349 RepID=UPI000AA4869C|nr:hypothetical protein [Nonlabens sp. YIK11]
MIQEFLKICLNRIFNRESNMLSPFCLKELSQIGEIVGLAILSAISNTYKSMEKTFINDPSTNKLFSNEEILRSMDKVMDKVKKITSNKLGLSLMI